MQTDTHTQTLTHTDTHTHIHTHSHPHTHSHRHTHTHRIHRILRVREYGRFRNERRSQSKEINVYRIPVCFIILPNPFPKKHQLHSKLQKTYTYNEFGSALFTKIVLHAHDVVVDDIYRFYCYGQCTSNFK